MKFERIPPGPGQESVWDYPSPPRLEDCSNHLKVVLCGVTIAETRRGKRVLETSHPPVYYFPPDDVQMGCLTGNEKQSWCEWKGKARYYDLRVEEQTKTDAAWSYPSPSRAFLSLRDYVAFYPHLMDACYVDGEPVQLQAGDFYGGWITGKVVGPFKGGPGTKWW